jgi:hypothetical protein
MAEAFAVFTWGGVGDHRILGPASGHHFLGTPFRTSREGAKGVAQFIIQLDHTICFASIQKKNHSRVLDRSLPETRFSANRRRSLKETNVDDEICLPLKLLSPPSLEKLIAHHSCWKISGTGKICGTWSTLIAL